MRMFSGIFFFELQQRQRCAERWSAHRCLCWSSKKNMPENIRILVADDDPLLREGVVHSLTAEPDFSVVGQASSGEDALRMARDLLPDVVLLDIGMPGWGGIVAAEKITTACPATGIVMLTVLEDEDKLLASFKASA